MQDSTILMPVLAVVLVNVVVLALAEMERYGLEPRWAALCTASNLFYAALYFWRRLRHRRRSALRRGLGYAAVVLGAFLSALMLCSFAPERMPLLLGVVLWLGLSLAAYCLYRIIVLHLEDQEAALLQLQLRPSI